MKSRMGPEHDIARLDRGSYDLLLRLSREQPRAAGSCNQPAPQLAEELSRAHRNGDDDLPAPEHADPNPHTSHRHEK